MSDHHPSQYGAINKAGDAVVRVVDSVTDAAKATVGDAGSQAALAMGGSTAEMLKLTSQLAGIDGPAGGYTQNNPHQGEQAPAEKTLPLPNDLERFASYNNIFTFGCISPEEINFPDKTYRQSGLQPGKILLRSNGLSIGDKPRTYAEQAYNIDTQYFIDDVEIETVVAPNTKSRATNFHTMRFKIREPYSMGQLLQSMQLCATNAGYVNYLEAPWLLIVEFLGYTNDSDTASSLPYKKMLPLKIVNVAFNVDTEGSNYDFVCSAFNDDAYSDSNQGIPVDITVSGNNLEQICQSGLSSLATHINTHHLNARKNEDDPEYEIDEYMFAFPNDNASKRIGDLLATESSNNTATVGTATKPNSSPEEVQAALATVAGDRNEYGQHSGIAYNFEPYSSDTNVALEKRLVDGRLGYSLKRSNMSQALKKILTGSEGDVSEIGTRKILPENPLSGGESPYGFSNFALNPETQLLERGGTKINPTQRTITFTRGTKIQRILEELVLLSDFGKRLADTAAFKTDGFIDWFRIEASVYIIEDKKFEAKHSRHPRIYLYKVLPYRVHSSVFKMPNSPPAGYDKVVQQAVKSYNYMYTGLNKDILEFDIQFDNQFYAAIASDSNRLDGANDQKSGGPPGRNYPEYNMGATFTGTNLSDNKKLKRIVGSGTQGGGTGAMIETSSIKLARQFNEAVMNSESDLISMKIKVLGDPYYIADSGIGNYNSENTAYYNINADGTMNHQSGEVDILMNFQTPIDINDNTGGYSMDGSALGVANFSGLFRVITVRNMFNGNLFTQEIDLVKRPNFKAKDVAPDNKELLQTPAQKQEKTVAEILEKYGDDNAHYNFNNADTDGSGDLDPVELKKAGLSEVSGSKLAKASGTLPPSLAETAKAAKDAEQQAAKVNETFGTGTAQAAVKDKFGGNNLI
tara:strand:+ start:2815 stop:5565 length:2751 start_codon:yes stop_codon:yes gene_type:complete